MLIQSLSVQPKQKKRKLNDDENDDYAELEHNDNEEYNLMDAAFLAFECIIEYYWSINVTVFYRLTQV